MVVGAISAGPEPSLAFLSSHWQQLLLQVSLPLKAFKHHKIPYLIALSPFSAHRCPDGSCLWTSPCWTTPTCR